MPLKLKGLPIGGSIQVRDPLPQAESVEGHYNSYVFQRFMKPDERNDLTGVTKRSTVDMLRNLREELMTEIKEGRVPWMNDRNFWNT